MDAYMYFHVIHGSHHFRQNEEQSCTICTEPLSPRDQGDSPRCCVEMRPCAHLFHRECILNNMIGTSPARNRCPNCRRELYRLNILSPLQLASVEADEEQHVWSVDNFNTNLYAFMMYVTDAYFMLQSRAPRDQEDWVGVITEVRQRWLREGYRDTYVCESHSFYTWDWFDNQVARRVFDRLCELGDPGDTRSARLLRAYCIALRDQLRGREEADFETPPPEEVDGDGQGRNDHRDDRQTLQNDDRRRIRTITPTRNDSPPIASVEEDEVMHDADNFADPSDSQSSVATYVSSGGQTHIMTIRTSLRTNGGLS